MKEWIMAGFGLTLILLVGRFGFIGAFGNVAAAFLISFFLFMSMPTGKKSKSARERDINFASDMFVIAILAIFFSWLFIKIELVQFLFSK